MCSRSIFSIAQGVLTAGAILLSGASTSAGDGPKPSPLSAPNMRTLEMVRVGAAIRLGKPECQQVLADFKDAEGQGLRANLEARGLSAPHYLQTITFVDGSQTRSCRRGPWVLMVARPRSESVAVCAVDGSPFTSRLAQVQRRNPALAEFILIHEMLHTLGLGEDPPTSETITRQVQHRCGSR
jgi:hypothetical protein